MRTHRGRTTAHGAGWTHRTATAIRARWPWHSRGRGHGSGGSRGGRWCRGGSEGSGLLLLLVVLQLLQLLLLKLLLHLLLAMVDDANRRGRWGGKQQDHEHSPIFIQQQSGARAVVGSRK